MKEIKTVIANLFNTPSNTHLLEELENQVISSSEPTEELIAVLVKAAQRALQAKQLELAHWFYRLAVTKQPENVELLAAMAQILDEELWRGQEALETYRKVVALDPNNQDAGSRLTAIQQEADNWEKILEKYITEADGASEPELATHLYFRAAEVAAKYGSDSEWVEMLLKKSYEKDPTHADTVKHIEYLLRARKRYAELADFLRGKLPRVEDPQERVACLLELAYLELEHTGEPQLAENHLKEAQKLSPGFEKITTLLVEAYTQQEKWEYLISLYENEYKNGANADEMCLQLGMLWWKKVGDLDTAEPYFQKLRKGDNIPPLVLNFYSEYYTAKDDYVRHLAMLQQAMRAAGSDLNKNIELARRISEISIEKSPDKAIDVWKRILKMDKLNATAIDALKDLYTRTEKWNALMELYKDIEHALSPEDVRGRILILKDMARLIEEKMHVDAMVVNVYTSILKLDPENEEVLDALAVKYEAMGRWRDVIVIYEGKVARESDPEKRKYYLRQVASLWGNKLSNPNKAAEPLEQILELDPTDRETIALLKDIYEKRRNWKGIFELRLKELALLPHSERREHYVELAKFAQQPLASPVMAIEMWNHVLEYDPHDIDAIENLIVLYEREKRYPALVEILRRKASMCIGDEALSLLEKTGIILSDKMGVSGDLVIRTWKKVLEMRPGHPKAMKVLKEMYSLNRDWEALEELFADRENWIGYIETLEECARKTNDSAEKVQLFFRVAEVFTRRLNKPERAVKSYENVLEVDPRNAQAAQLLLPLYEENSRWKDVARMLELLADNASSEAKLPILLKLVDVNEEKLGQPDHAFDWCAQAYSLALRDTALLMRLERLAEKSGKWRELASLYASVADRFEGEEKIRHLSRLAHLTVDKLSDLESGEAIWRSVLAMDNQYGEALLGLASIYELRGEWSQLLDILNQQITSAPRIEDRLAAMMKMGQVMESRMARPTEAIEMYKRVVTQDPAHLPALEALDRLYEASRMYENLAHVLRQEEALYGDEKRMQIRLRLGQLFLGPLSDPQEALACFESILEEAPHHEGTLLALENMIAPGFAPEIRVKAARLMAQGYRDMEKWEAYARSMEVIAELEQDYQKKIELYSELLNITVRRVGDTARGLEIAKILFELSPANEDIRHEIRRLAVLEDQVPTLVSLYIQALEKHPELQVILAWELALLQEEILHNPENAETYYRMVLDADALHEKAFLALERLYTGTQRWTDLRALIEMRLDVLTDATSQKEMLLKLSLLNENILEDFNAAIVAYRQLRQLEPGSQEAFVALVRLFEKLQDWASLADLYQEELAYVRQTEQRILLLVQRADLLMHQLQRAEDAVGLLQEVVASNPSHIAARHMLEETLAQPETRQISADILLNLHERENNHEAVVKLLDVKLETAVSPEESVGILSRQGKLFTVQLVQPEKAFEAWRRAIRIEPGNAEVRNALEELVDIVGNREQLVEVWQEAIQSAGDAVELRMLYIEKIAVLYERDLGNPEKAVEWYRHLLAASTEYEEIQARATTRLIQLLSVMDEWIDVIDLYRRQLNWLQDARERKSVYRKIASLQEDMLDALQEAADTYHRMLEEFPGDEDALDRLESIYSRLENWAKLVDVLQQRAELTQEPSIRRDFYSRIAILREESLQDIEGAAAAWAAILDEYPEDGTALRSLARLSAVLSRWAEVFDLVDRELALTTNPNDRLALMFRLGDILQNHLNEPARAIAYYRDVIEQDPGHEKAKEALEQLLQSQDETLAMEAALILEKIYELEDNWEKLATLYVLKAGYSVDPQEKVDLFVRIADIKENRLSEPLAAFGFYGQAFKECLALPQLPDILGNLQRLAAGLGKWGELVDLYKSCVDDILDAAIQEQVSLFIADVARDELKNLELARTFYRKVLEQRPDSREALDALEFVYKEMSDWEDLLGVYLKRAELDYSNPEVRYSALVNAALLCRDPLKRPAEAIRIYREILEFRPDDAAIFRALEELYFDQEQWEDLIELYDHRIRYVDDIIEAVEIRYNMGEIYQDYLKEPERALEMFKAALGGDPSRENTVRRLEKFLDMEDYAALAAETLVPIYASRENWKELVRVFKLQRQMLESPEERAPITRKIASLYDEVIDDMDSAFEWYGYLFVEQPQERKVRNRLLTLAENLGYWKQVSEVFAKVLEEAYGDLDYILELAEHQARILSRRLSNVEGALSCYKRIVEADRNRTDIFEEMERMLVEVERWEDLLSVYREATEAHYDPERKNRFYFKMCEVYEDKLHNYEAAVETYKEILVNAPEDTKANDALRRLYTRLERWDDLIEHLLVLVGQQQLSTEQVCEINLTLANLYHEKQSDPNSAIDRIEQVLQLDPINAQAIRFLETMLRIDEVALRAAALLQPIYEQLDQWEDLVNVYEIQIAGIDDQYVKIDYLKKCAALYDSRGNRLDRAFSSLSQAWLLDTSDHSLFEELYQLTVRRNNWEELISVYEKGITDVYDTALQVEVLLRIARIRSEILSDIPKACEAYRHVLNVQEDHLEALTELALLLESQQAWEELVEVLERRCTLLSEPQETVRTLRQLAQLQKQLNRFENAVESYRRILEIDAQDTDALLALEGLYEQLENWSELADILRTQSVLVETEDFSVAMKLARLQEEKLEDNYEAIATLQRVLAAAPDHITALSSCARLYEKESNWMELIGILNRLVILETDDVKRNELVFRIASVYQHEINDVEQALSQYANILEFNPQHEKTLAELEDLLEGEEYREKAAILLEPLYVAASQIDKQIHLVERLLEIAVEPDRKVQFLRKLAGIHESRGDLKNAFVYWGLLLRENPADTEVEAQLFRVAAMGPFWQDLVELLDAIAEDVYDIALRKHLVLKIAELYEISLEDSIKAISALQKGLDAVPGDQDLLTQLDRLLTETQNFKALQEVLRTEADVSEGHAKAQFLYRLGALLLHSFEQGEEAIEVWQEALAVVPDHEGVLQEMEKILEVGGNLVPKVVEVLEPLYESRQAHTKLVQLLEIRVKLVEDPAEKADFLERASRTCQLTGDLERSVDLLAQAVALAPDNMVLVENFIQVAQTLDRISAVVACVQNVLKGSIDDSTAVALALRVAPLALASGDVSASEGLYLAVLERDAENMDALQALEQLYRAGADTSKLVSILQKRAANEYNPEQKKAICSEIASLAETQLHDDILAEKAWKDVLESDESDADAQRELSRLYEKLSRYVDLIEILKLRINYTVDMRKQQKLRQQIAEIYGQKLGKPEQAEETWREAYDTDPSFEPAVSALLAIYSSKSDWDAVKDILFTRLSQAAVDSERIAVLMELAALASEKLNDIDEAVSYWLQILEKDPMTPGVFEKLQAVLTQNERYYELADALQKRANAFAQMGDRKNEVFTLDQLARLWEDKLESPTEAQKILERILATDPGNVTALTGLARIFGNMEDWEHCQQYLEKAALLEPQGEEGAELAFRRGKVAEKLQDTEKAVACYEEALRLYPIHQGAFDELSARARAADDKEAILRLMQKRMPFIQEPSQRLHSLLQMADLFIELGASEGAFPLLEEALQLDPANTGVKQKLGDAYFAAGNYAKAADLYQKLLDDHVAAKAPRKELAPLYQRLGSIQEGQGDLQGALDFYTQAQKANTTYVPNLVAMARLYARMKNYEQAQRMFRALLFQRLEGDITKADVFYEIALIEIETGNASKAKTTVQRGLSENPTHPGLKKLLSEL